MRGLVIGFLLVVSVVSVSGAERSPERRRLALHEFIAHALESAPDLKVALFQLQRAEGQLVQAERSRFLPEFDVVSTTGPTRRARGTVLEPRDNFRTNNFGPFTRVEVQFVQPLYTFGKITAGIEAAAHAVEAQRAAGRIVRGQLIEQIKTLYYNILLARSVAGIMAETTEGFDDALVTARERRDDGDVDISELDILYLRVGRAEVAKEVPRLEAAEAVALRALRGAAGFPIDTQVDLAERFLSPEVADIEPLESYQARLFPQNPTWRQAQAGLAAKGEELNTILADFYPQFFLAGGFTYAYAPDRERQLNPFAYDEFNRLDGPGAVFGIRWALNFHITKAKLDVARAELNTMQAQVERAESGLSLELREAYRDVLSRREALEAITDGRKAGRAILTLAVTNFDIGIGDANEILQGLGNYARVTTAYYEAVLSYDLALAKLSRVLGEEITPKVASPRPPKE